MIKVKFYQRVTDIELLTAALLQYKVTIYQEYKNKLHVIEDNGIVEKFSKNSIRISGNYYLRNNNLILLFKRS